MLNQDKSVYASKIWIQPSAINKATSFLLSALIHTQAIQFNAVASQQLHLFPGRVLVELKPSHHLVSKDTATQYEFIIIEKRKRSPRIPVFEITMYRWQYDKCEFYSSFMSLRGKCSKVYSVFIRCHVCEEVFVFVSHFQCALWSIYHR